MGRYFVSVEPSKAVRAVLSTIEAPDTTGVRWTPPDQWHLTLAFLADVDEAEATAALGRVRHPPVRVELGPAVELLGPGVIIVPAVGLDELAAAVEAAFVEIVPELERREFRGHLTLARARSGVPPGLVGLAVTASFEVSAIDLVVSMVGHRGARHRRVARRRLGS